MFMIYLCFYSFSYSVLIQSHHPFGSIVYTYCCPHFITFIVDKFNNFLFTIFDINVPYEDDAFERDDDHEWAS